MQTLKLSAEPRTDLGKGAVRRLRATGKIPAVAYGPTLDATSISISPKDVTTVLATERGRNSVIELSVGSDRKLTVLLTAFQYHPVTRELLHADFREIKEDQPIDVEVPFEATGKAKGVVAGGVLRIVYRKLPIRCLPALVPAKLTHDVTELELDNAIHAKDLNLPEGVTVRLPPEQTVIAVAMEKKQPDEAEAAPGAAAAGAAPAAGAGAAGAAPAAGAAAPAAGGKGAATPAAKGAKPSK
ncbi:MAG TPA: 50S ribosomal protein L25 [Polyangiaceae bacterium]|jgi:large subunit ribosomal protein L25|nr:50S ribosomal protein L25 [Polyangiaceae bacterium]